MSAKYKDFSHFHTTLLLTLALSISSKYGYVIENITQSQKLSQGNTLVSPGRVYELGFFSPNNSRNHQYVGIWYKGISPQTLVWVANRDNPLREADSSASFNIGLNGNLELLDGNSNTLWWSTNVSIKANTSVATLSDNGNFELKDAESGQNLWQSFDHPGDTMLPNSKLGYNVKTGQSLVLTSWKGENDPSPGSFTFEISKTLKPAQVFVWNGTNPHWRSGPWGGSKFIGIQEMAGSYRSQFSLVEDPEKGTTYLSYTSYNASTTSKMLLSSVGELKYFFKENGGDWYTLWQSYNNPCDVYGFCGAFGVCKASETPICSCLRGFVPKSNLEWSERNWTQGCIRRTKLRCELNISSSQGQNDDGFLVLHNMKLPDFYEFLPDNQKSFGSCETSCLDLCDCRAFTYVTGIGCLVWFKDLVDISEFSSNGEDLYLRLPLKELDGRRRNKKIIIISVTTISCSVSLIVLLLIILRRWRANQTNYVNKTTEKSDSIQTRKTSKFDFQYAEQHDLPEFPIFNFEAILVATDNFNIENKLGQGGFGPVYKGKLQDGTNIAVKRLASSSGQGIVEFMNEIILISKLQHRNLVRLIGCCIDRDERLIIYEFMPNKSLDNFIIDSTRRAELNWTTRFTIISGIARGLLYLHRDSTFRVIHRDLKLGNILLDDKMNPKISDFGLARMFQGTFDLGNNTNRVVGTFGYMSPEYAMGGVFSEKSDVFSFGVLMLEIVSGRKNTSFNYDDQHQSLISHAWHLWSEGRGLEMVDNALEISYSSMEEAMRCIQIGLLCIQDQPADRPTMADVVSMLANERDRPNPKEPIFTFQRSFELPQQNDIRYSSNEATMSSIEGR